MNFKAILRTAAAALLIGGIACGLAACTGKAELSEAPARADAGPSLADIPTDKSADKLLAELKKTDYVVIEDVACTNGREKLDEFMEACKRGEPGVLRYAHYYTLDPERCAEEYYEREKDNYPQLFVGELEFDGSCYYMTIRKSDEQEPDPRENRAKYACFKHEIDKTLEYYYLVDSEEITVAELQHQWLSSTLLPHYDRCHFVAMFKPEA